MAPLASTIRRLTSLVLALFFSLSLAWLRHLLANPFRPITMTATIVATAGRS
jgi:hypothetical protein